MWLGKQQYDPAWYSLGMRWPTGCIIDMFCLYNTSNNGNQTKKTRIWSVTGTSPCWWPCEMLFPSSLLVASPLSVCCPLTNLKLSWSLFFPTKIKHISQLGSTSQQGSKTTIATSKLCRWDICCLPIKARNVASLHSWRSTFRLKPSKLSQQKSGLKQKNNVCRMPIWKWRYGGMRQ